MLVIKSHQRDALELQAHRDFRRRACDALGTLWAGVDPSRLESLFTATRKLARPYDLESETDVVRLFNLALILGDLEQTPWVHQVLRQEPGSRRWHCLAARAARHLLQRLEQRAHGLDGSVDAPAGGPVEQLCRGLARLEGPGGFDRRRPGDVEMRVAAPQVRAAGAGPCHLVQLEICIETGGDADSRRRFLVVANGDPRLLWAASGADHGVTVLGSEGEIRLQGSARPDPGCAPEQVCTALIQVGAEASFCESCGHPQAILDVEPYGIRARHLAAQDKPLSLPLWAPAPATEAPAASLYRVRFRCCGRRPGGRPGTSELSFTLRLAAPQKEFAPPLPCCRAAPLDELLQLRAEIQQGGERLAELAPVVRLQQREAQAAVSHHQQVVDSGPDELAQLEQQRCRLHDQQQAHQQQLLTARSQLERFQRMDRRARDHTARDSFALYMKEQELADLRDALVQAGDDEQRLEQRQQALDRAQQELHELKQQDLQRDQLALMEEELQIARDALQEAEHRQQQLADEEQAVVGQRRARKQELTHQQQQLDRQRQRLQRLVALCPPGDGPGQEADASAADRPSDWAALVREAEAVDATLQGLKQQCTRLLEAAAQLEADRHRTAELQQALARQLRRRDLLNTRLELAAANGEPRRLVLGSELAAAQERLRQGRAQQQQRSRDHADLVQTVKQQQDRARTLLADLRLRQQQLLLQIRGALSGQAAPLERDQIEI